MSPPDDSRPHRHRRTVSLWNHAAFAAALTWAFAGCRANAEDGPTETTAWVGHENVVVARQQEIVVGPAISGTLEARRRATVRAEVAGAVVAIAAEAGQAVRRGDALGRIDDTAIRDAFESARALVRSAERSAQLADRNLDRAKALVEAGAIAARDLEEAQVQDLNARSALEDARARLASAEKQLAKTTIRAPFSGVVGERPISVGDVVQPGTALFTVVDPTSLEFEGLVPVEALPTLAVGTRVTFIVPGVDASLEARVVRIHPVVDPATRQVRVTVGLPPGENRVLAGLFAEGRVASVVREGIIVPAGAVDRSGIRPTVVRVKGGRVEDVEVELGLVDAAREEMEVRAGLTAGDTVLLGGARGLTAGTLVRIGSPAELPAQDSGTGGS